MDDGLRHAIVCSDRSRSGVARQPRVTRREAAQALESLASLHDQHDERELRAALTSLRDAPLTDAAAAHLARSCPGFVAALAWVCDLADEMEAA